MTDEARPEAGSADGAAPADAAGDQQQTRTPEQVEAEWQAKQSALGRQHAATEKALRDQIAALQAFEKAAGDKTGTEADAIRQENEALKKQLADQSAEYLLSIRRAKYPQAAETLDDAALKAMDEAKLAGLEARLTPAQQAAMLLSSTPPRDSATPKPMSEKTTAELQADLIKYAPEWQQRIRENVT